MNNVHFKSSDREWETPESLFTPLQEEFNIVFDLCASANNAKCKAYFDKRTNALSTSWSIINEFCEERCSGWMNPPYGRGIEKWVKKAYDESLKGVTVVALLPARTDTFWFHNYIYNKCEVRFLKGRIKFVGADSNAPFPSMIVIFRPPLNKQTSKWIKYLKLIKVIK